MFNQKKHWILHILMFGSKSRTTCYRFSFASPDENCSTPGILRETSYRHIPKCNERFARQYRSVSPRKCHLSGPNTHALTRGAVCVELVFWRAMCGCWCAMCGSWCWCSCVTMTKYMYMYLYIYIYMYMYVEIK